MSDLVNAKQTDTLLSRGEMEIWQYWSALLCCFGRISVDLQIKKNFFAESPLLCMAHLLEREGKQKKNLNFPLDKGQRPLMRVSVSGNVLKQSLIGK